MPHASLYAGHNCRTTVLGAHASIDLLTPFVLCHVVALLRCLLFEFIISHLNLAYNLFRTATIVAESELSNSHGFELPLCCPDPLVSQGKCSFGVTWISRLAFSVLVAEYSVLHTAAWSWTCPYADVCKSIFEK